jgi:5-formyltetrahydrofolate cyclo-ligase
LGGLGGPQRVVATTVHDLQVQAVGEIPRAAHDIHVDLVVTPTRVIDCPRPASHRRPELHWDELTDEKIEAIPLLGRLRSSR